MLSQNEDFRKFAFKYKICRYYSSIITPIILYAPPSCGKTHFMREVMKTGLPVIDSDDIFFGALEWFKKRNPTLSEDECRAAADVLSGWFLFNTMMVGEVSLIVTNLHNSFLVCGARYGCTIIGYLPPYELFLTRLAEREKKMKIDKQKYIGWYNDALKWKNTSYDKINFWVDDIDDILYLIYSKLNNGFGICKMLSRYHPGIFEGKTSAHTLRTAIAIYVSKQNKTLIALGCNDIELYDYANIGKRMLGYGKVDFLVEDPVVPDEKEYPPLKDFVDYVKVSNTIKTLCSMCCDITDLIVIGSVPLRIKLKYLDINVIYTRGYTRNDALSNKKTNVISDIKRELKKITNSIKGKFAVLIYDKSAEFGLAEYTTSTGLYSKKFAADLSLVRYFIANSNCVRVCYIPIVKEGFDKTLILDIPLKVFYLPYFTTTMVRCCFLFDRWLVGLKKKFSYSLHEIESNGKKFNNARYKSHVINDILYKYIAKCLIRNGDILNYDWQRTTLLNKSKYYFVGLFCLSNTTNDRSKVAQFINYISSHVNCLFNLPNINAEPSLYEEDRIINGIMTTTHGERVYTDLAYDPNSFVQYQNVQVYDTMSILGMCQFYNVDGKWHRIPLPVCNSNSPKFKVWFFAGNVLSEEEMKYQTIFNSQTEKMNSIARLCRICSGFDANVVYAIRVKILKSLVDTKDKLFAVSNAMTYFDKKNGEVICVSGHAINLLIASKIFVVDIKRWIKTVKANLLMDDNYKNTVTKLRQNNMLAEPDNILNYWHTPKDFNGVVSVANELLTLYGLEPVESYNIKEFSEISKLPDISTVNVNKLDISKD